MDTHNQSTAQDSARDVAELVAQFDPLAASLARACCRRHGIRWLLDDAEQVARVALVEAASEHATLPDAIFAFKAKGEIGRALGRWAAREKRRGLRYAPDDRAPEHVQVDAEDGPVLEDARPSQHDQRAAAQERHALERALDELDRGDRAFVEAIFAGAGDEGLSVSELAERFRLSRSAAGRRRQRILEKLRIMVGRSPGSCRIY